MNSDQFTIANITIIIIDVIRVTKLRVKNCFCFYITRGSTCYRYLSLSHPEIHHKQMLYSNDARFAIPEVGIIE